MAGPEFTVSSLHRSLTSIMEADSERNSALAVSTAAAMIQEMLLTQGHESVMEQFLSDCPKNLQGLLDPVLDSVVNRHALPNGKELGFWMTPVVLSGDEPMPGYLPLETSSTRYIKLSARLATQFRSNGSSDVWVHVLPGLYSDALMSAQDVSSLVRFPRQVHELIRGARRAVTLPVTAGMELQANSTHLYYLPFIVCRSADADFKPPEVSLPVKTLLMDWVAAVRPDVRVKCAPVAHPFSIAREVGAALQMETTLMTELSALSQNTGVAPNGLVALVAGYHPMGDQTDVCIGVTLTSRLTGALLAHEVFPARHRDIEDDLSVVSSVLRAQGLKNIQVFSEVQSMCCQYCGEPHAPAGMGQDSGTQPTDAHIH